MMSFAAFVDDSGHFALDNREAFRAHIQKLKGQEIVVTVKKRTRRLNDKVGRYYRGVVIVDIAKSQGYTDPDDYESVHDGIAWKFLRIADGPMGQPRRRSTSPTDMSKEEMSQYVTDVINWAETTLTNCRVRRPDEVDEDALVDQEWR